ncbi:hypothetical protein BU26DRAFT_549701 [Trematosphaeria pertusa]|uniref:DUF6590 domain-containing protein n=1 Tax=Trematosphaeria pertusa TaxID=390896 RepID=A0A6A6IMT2_9PLEO|nr:uncharacterized protein BU26DRAFT_549701 [Trematosphaeria pertusa]KAF2251132.1 hypothetical protein BU26DRAFT_549701 [Trematosphaeria pertusa]
MTSDDDYQILNKPRTFFKTGRIFLVREGNITRQTLVVVASRNNHCVCLPIETFRPAAPLNTSSHAPVSLDGQGVQMHPQERQYGLGTIGVVVENRGVAMSPLSRIAFTEAMTVEYKTAVRNVGRVKVGMVDDESLAKLNQYYQTLVQ